MSIHVIDNNGNEVPLSCGKTNLQTELALAMVKCGEATLIVIDLEYTPTREQWLEDHARMGSIPSGEPL